jgi:hypothetical protein
MPGLVQHRTYPRPFLRFIDFLRILSGVFTSLDSDFDSVLPTLLQIGG